MNIKNGVISDNNVVATNTAAGMVSLDRRDAYCIGLVDGWREGSRKENKKKNMSGNARNPLSVYSWPICLISSQIINGEYSDASICHFVTLDDEYMSS
ncbi:hypothetical protein AAMO2058_001209200 [Amorphochlora amoebiformis]